MVLWYAKQAKTYIQGDALTITTTETLLTLFTASTAEVEITSITKDVRVSGGDRDVEAVDLFGPNQLIQEGRPALMEVQFTIVYQDNDEAVGFLRGPTTVATTYSRMQGGEATSNDRATQSVLFELTDGTNSVYVLFNNAYETNREISLGADGHVESTLTYKCLATDYYEETDLA